MKLQLSPATDPRAGWRETIIEQRSEIEALMRNRQTFDSRLTA